MTKRLPRIDNQEIKTRNKGQYKKKELRITLKWNRKTEKKFEQAMASMLLTLVIQE